MSPPPPGSKPPSGDGEADRVREASQGDATAIEKLLAAHLPGIRAYLRHHAGPGLLERESAADLAQSVAREALQHLADARFEYRGEAEFKQWLYQAALLKVKSRRRYWAADKRARPREKPLDSDPDRGLADFFRSTASPSRHAEINEQVAAMSEAFAELPRTQRRIVELARVKGLSHRRIAQELGISEANSRMQLSRALARLASLAHQRLGTPRVD